MKREKIDLGATSVAKVFWTYAIPSMLAMIAQSTAGLVDSMFVGRYVGPEGLSAITLMMPITWLLIGIGAMIAIGGTTLAGIAYGAGDYEKSNNYFNVTMLFLIISGTVAMFLLRGFRLSIADFVGASGLVHDYLVEYSGTMCWFLVFFLMNFAFTFFLKLDSRPIAVVLITISGTLINIILDYVLVAHLKQGLYGAALATGISQLLPWLMFMYIAIKQSKWYFAKPFLIWKDVRMIFFNGSSEMLSNISVAVMGTLFNWIIISRIGVDAIAAYAVTLQIGGLVVGAGYGVSESNQTGLSYNFGAQKLDRVNAIFELTRNVNISIGILFALVSFFFGEHVAKLFVTEKETVTLAVDILKFYSVSFALVGLNISYGTYYTAVNDPISSVAVTFLRSFLAIVIGLAFLPYIFGTDGIWVTALFAEVVTFISVFFIKRKYPYGREKRTEAIVIGENLEKPA